MVKLHMVPCSLKSISGVQTVAEPPLLRIEVHSSIPVLFGHLFSAVPKFSALWPIVMGVSLVLFDTFFKGYIFLLL